MYIYTINSLSIESKGTDFQVDFGPISVVLSVEFVYLPDFRPDHFFCIYIPMKHICTFLFVLLLLGSCTVRRQGRQTIDFTSDWRFVLQDIKDGHLNATIDSNWRRVDLPHDWSIESHFSDSFPATPGGGALPGGIGWYRKTFTLDESCQDKCVFVDFDGVYRNSQVWINGHFLGERPSGYQSFRYDLTPFIKIGQQNVLAVRVDNSEQPNSRWYSGSGIYRNVRLVVTYPVHVANWGTYVTVPKADIVDARINIATTINNLTITPQEVVVEQSLVDPDGREVGKSIGKMQMESKSQKTLKQNFRVDKPRLWRLKEPDLYTLYTKLFCDGKQMDEYTTTVGIRTIRFDAKTGFKINGLPTKINGVCLHHDFGALGSAVYTAAIKRQIKLLKEMGCNAIRTSHNPPSPELLDLCDREGMLVMDEAFDVWRKSKTTYDYSKDFDEWANTDLADFIKRDRNHPSVILWSIGNEVGEQWPGAEGRMSSVKTAKALADVVRSLDPTRPITAGCNETGKNNPLFEDGVLDVIGFNYHHQEFSKTLERFPNKPFIATETVSALMSRGVYMQPSTKELLWPERWDKPFSHPSQQCSAYDQCHAPWGSTHEQTLLAVQNQPHVTGQFVWTGFDYLGEPTPYGWPSRSSYFGIIDLAGFPKDVYYLYQSVWSKSKVLHVFPHWNHEKGQTVDVWAYYNQADEAELYINGVSQGKKSKDKETLHVMWRTKFEPGTLKVVTRKKGKIVMVKTVKTAGKAVSIRLTPDGKKFNADGKDLCFVRVELIDKDGNVLPTAQNEVTFNIKGEGRIVGTDNGNPVDATSLKLPQRKLFNGKCLVIVQSTREAGELELSANVDQLPKATLSMKTK